MALQAVKYGFALPEPPKGWTGAPTFGTMAMTASGHKVAGIFQATAAKSVRKIWFRTVTVTTGDTTEARIETVDPTNGDPTGTLVSANANGTVSVASADDNVWKSVTLTADTPLSITDTIASVLVNGSGGGNMQIATWSDDSAAFPYSDLNTGSWAKDDNMPVMVFEYSDGSFEPIFGLTQFGGPFNTSTFNSGSATNRRGNMFQVAFPTRAKGCWVWVDADGDFTVKLYDSDGSTVLATTATIKSGQRNGAAAALQHYPFTTTPSLVAGTNYRLAVVAETVTNLSTHDFDVPAAAMLDMFQGGQACKASVYTSGAWVETSTRRGFLGVYLDAFDDATGGGGATAGGPALFGRVLG